VSLTQKPEAVVQATDASAPTSWADAVLHVFDGIAQQDLMTQIAWMVFLIVLAALLVGLYHLYQRHEERKKQLVVEQEGAAETVPLALADKLITGLGEQQRDLMRAHQELTAVVSRAVEQTTAPSRSVDAVSRQVETLYHSHMSLSNQIAEHGEKLEEHGGTIADHSGRVTNLADRVEKQGDVLQEHGRRIEVLTHIVGFCPTNCAANGSKTINFVPDFGNAEGTIGQ